ncbi:MAG TPA: molybdopterin-binding protein [Burkholderiaceae bacterium]|nr:molybdopterin-binding protein [Burkholderiaceae bacterium]
MDDVPRFGLIVVGDEILSGKRGDKHFAKVIELLGARGLALEWAQYLPDDRPRLIASLQSTFGGPDHVFSCGGIGSTPDDHTRQAAAAALGRELVLHPEAAELIAARCRDLAAEGRGSADMSTPENRQRLKMGEFPAGSTIIPNPYNRIAGFAVSHHWFVPGFPVMAWPMIEWVLDTQYAKWFHRARQAERSLIVFDTPESAVAPVMEEIESRFSAIKAFSLPSVGDGSDGRIARRHIELGIKGPVEQIDAAFAQLRLDVARLGAEFEERG